MLMSGGAAVFDEIVPGWRERLATHGAIPFDAMADAATRFPAGWISRVPSGLTMYACSRSLLEEVLLKMLADLPNVSLLSHLTVVGLLVDMERNQVTGVRSSKGDLRASLVIDASGTASRMRKWLADLAGRDKTSLRETVVSSPWQYVSQWWRLPPGRAPDWASMSIAPELGSPLRAGMMLRAERDCWNVVLLAGAGQKMPTETASFLRFAADVGEGELAKAIALGEPMTPVHAYGRTANRFRHWGEVSDLPDGLAVIGDAAMTLDPYRGLGMTAASMSVQLLSRTLDKCDATEFRSIDFHRDLARNQEWPWQVVTGHDTTGHVDDRQTSRLAELFELAPRQPRIARAVFECHHLVRPIDQLIGETAI
jgi:2-polyprenyl-6-methoxyphenol hydroxylase-like FAD-dependent oxidoreductase